METELTRTIKTMTHFFKPIMNTDKRTIRYADEVWTPTGIVDSIRFEDFIVNESDSIICRAKEFGYPIIQETCDRCKPKGCSGCMNRKRVAQLEYGIMTTCFEVKISVSDFKSKNGHNFHGNKNYYVVPKDILQTVLPLVPDGIGLIQYTAGGLRIKKECDLREIDDKLLNILLYNAMKKWCDSVR